MMMVNIGENRWVNPNYVVAAVLHEEDGRAVLTLTMDYAALHPSTPQALYPDVRGEYIAPVMEALACYFPKNHYDKERAESNG